MKTSACVVVALACLLGCGIDDLKVQEGSGGQGGAGREARAGTSGKAEGQGGAGAQATGGAGTAGSGDAGKGGSGKAGSGGAGSGGAGGKAGAGGAGGTGGAAGSGGTGVSAELMTAINQLIDVQCSKLDQCAPFAEASQFGSADKCRTRSHLQYDWVASLPGVGWTAAKVSACKSVVEAQSCRQYVDDDGQTECMVAGSRQNGEPCNTREQCASRFCKGTGYGCGMCAAPPAEGASCKESNECPDRTVCGCSDAQCSQTVCVRPRNEGESCSATIPCGYGLNCLADGSCHAAPNQAGASCSAADNVQCDVTLQGLVCNTNNNTCLKLTAADDCSGTNYCRQAGSVCDAGSGTCSAPPSDSGPCAENDSCLFPALCVNGSCQLPGAGSKCQ